MQYQENEAVNIQLKLCGSLQMSNWNDLLGQQRKSCKL